MDTNANARITIDYNAYDYLKNIEFQMNFLINNIRRETLYDGTKIIPKHVGRITKKEFDEFVYNLVGIEELIIEEIKDE